MGEEEMTNEQLVSAMEELERDVSDRRELLEWRKALLENIQELDIQHGLIKAKIRQIWMDAEVRDNRAAI